MERRDQREQRTKRAALKHYIEAEFHTLRGILRAYVIRLGVAPPGENTDAVAEDLLNEVVVRALDNIERYDHQRRPMAWLIGIALNVIREKRRQPQTRREIPVHDLYPQADLSEDELFERLNVAENPFAELESLHATTDLLACVPDYDRQIIQLAVLHELDSTTIARELGITPGAVRVRLHRALRRIRTASTENNTSDTERRPEDA